MNDLSLTFNGVALNQPNSFLPQLNARLDIKYQPRYGGQPQPNYVEIVNTKIKLRVIGKNKQQWTEIGLAEQEFSCSIRPTDITTMHLVFRLSPYILHKIEELRMGGDLTFQFEPLSTAIAITDQGGISKTETVNFQIQGNQWEYPRSKWVDHLNAIDFNKIELVEIPKIDFPQIPLTERIVRFLDDANKAMTDGRYGDVLQECRKSIEALETGVKEWGKKNEPDQEQINKNGKISEKIQLENYFTKLIGEPEKARRLNELRGTIRYYLSLDPHEAEYKTIVFTRDDAKFVLHTTIGFINNILKYMADKKQ